MAFVFLPSRVRRGLRTYQIPVPAFPSEVKTAQTLMYQVLQHRIQDLSWHVSHLWVYDFHVRVQFKDEFQTAYTTKAALSSAIGIPQSRLEDVAKGVVWDNPAASSVCVDLMWDEVFSDVEEWRVWIAALYLKYLSEGMNATVCLSAVYGELRPTYILGNDLQSQKLISIPLPRITRSGVGGSMCSYKTQDVLTCLLRDHLQPSHDEWEHLLR